MIFKIVFTKNGRFLNDSIEASNRHEAIQRVIAKHSTDKIPITDVRIVMAHE